MTSPVGRVREFQCRRRRRLLRRRRCESERRRFRLFGGAENFDGVTSAIPGSVPAGQGSFTRTTKTVRYCG
jgi:hypothetical protein